MRTTRRVSLSLLAVSGAHAYHQSEFEGLWEQVPQTCINVRAGDTTRDSTAKEMPKPERWRPKHIHLPWATVPHLQASEG